MSGPVLIQGAMEVETDWLVSRLERPEAFSWGGFQFWRGDFQGLDLTVSRTGIGTIYAAGATAVGIEKFHPRVVINQGIAGSHCESLHVGDIVVGESCIHIHNLKTPPRGGGRDMMRRNGSSMIPTTGRSRWSMPRTRYGWPGLRPQPMPEGEKHPAVWAAGIYSTGSMTASSGCGSTRESGVRIWRALPHTSFVIALGHPV